MARLFSTAHCLRLFLVVALLLMSSNLVRAQITTFTYQGRLQDAGGPANGSYDLQFTLWDAASAGTQQPQPSPVTLSRASVLVAAGVFTVQLDFGANAFPGANRFLEIGVRPAGGGTLTILSPRQQTTSTPYAVRSLTATSADTLSPACNGCVTGATIPAGQVVKSLNNLFDNVTLAAGSNITITPAGNTLTLASTGGGSGLSSVAHNRCK